MRSDETTVRIVPVSTYAILGGQGEGGGRGAFVSTNQQQNITLRYLPISKGTQKKAKENVVYLENARDAPGQGLRMLQKN